MYRMITMVLGGLISLSILTINISCAEKEEGKPEKKAEKKVETTTEKKAEKAAPEKKEEVKKEAEKDTKAVEGLIKEVMSINDVIQTLPEEAFVSDAESVKDDVESILLDDVIGGIKERDIMTAAFLDMAAGIIEDEVTDRKAGEDLLHRVDALIEDIEGRGWTSPAAEKKKQKKQAEQAEKTKTEGDAGKGKSQ